MVTLEKRRSTDGYTFTVVKDGNEELGRFRHVGGRAMRCQSFISHRSHQTPYGRQGAVDFILSESGREPVDV